MVARQIDSTKDLRSSRVFSLVVLVTTGQQYDECAKTGSQWVKWQLRVVDAEPALRCARAAWAARSYAET